MRFDGEITDPVHRYLRFSAVEKDLIDTPIFQRLRRIRQLAGAHLVYPGAQHSRFEHSLGTMHVAGYAGEALLAKGYLDDEDEVQKLRLAALLHDVGHGPFSHLFEEVLELKRKISHEDIGKQMISQSSLSDTLKKHGYNPSDICRLSFGESKIKFLFKAVYFHKTVRSAEVMLLNSMLLADEYLSLTNTSINSYIDMTDEVILGRMCSPINGDKIAVKLATDYKDRRLLKCVYEKFVHKRDRLYSKMDRQALDSLGLQIAAAADVKEKTVFVDASRAPSMPLTPTKREINSVLLVDKDWAYETPISEIPLIDSITGFLDMLRVYTYSENRTAVEQSIKKVLDNEGFA
jgi:HD superfamily phosphohydrolase